MYKKKQKNPNNFEGNRYFCSPNVKLKTIILKATDISAVQMLNFVAFKIIVFCFCFFYTCMLQNKFFLNYLYDYFNVKTLIINIFKINSTC
jgi:hypothetical protein